jgi:CheY-like chemotaxis protein
MTDQTTVLVAESDDELAKVLTQALTGHGWKVLQARDAVSATATIRRDRPDAVVLNQKLPGGGGLLALRRLRASIHTTMTPVIAIVGTRDGDEDELRQHGVDECVTIPLDAGAIAEWIQKRLMTPTVVMDAPSSILHDPERLASLAQTGHMDTSFSEPLDALTRVAASILGVPVALVSLVDDHRQFFKSHIGLPEPWATDRETPLTHSFCQWVVADHEDLIVSDAREHPALKHNRALHEIGVIAYAGVPLTTTAGLAIGSFCAIDTKPRAWSADDIRILKELASVADACTAFSEFQSTADGLVTDAEMKGISRAAAVRAAGEAMAHLSAIFGGDHPTLDPDQRQEMASLLGWLGRELVSVAGA